MTVELVIVERGYGGVGVAVDEEERERLLRNPLAAADELEDEELSESDTSSPVEERGNRAPPFVKPMMRRCEGEMAIVVVC